MFDSPSAAPNAGPLMGVQIPHKKCEKMKKLNQKRMDAIMAGFVKICKKHKTALPDALMVVMAGCFVGAVEELGQNEAEEVAHGMVAHCLDLIKSAGGEA